MEQSRISASRLILLLIGVCLGMTLVATVTLWSGWSPLMRGLVLVADLLWIAGASRLVIKQSRGDLAARRVEPEAADATPQLESVTSGDGDAS